MGNMVRYQWSSDIAGEEGSGHYDLAEFLLTLGSAAMSTDDQKSGQVGGEFR